MLKKSFGGARHLAQLDTTDRQELSGELAAKAEHLKEKLVKLETRCNAWQQWRR